MILESDLKNAASVESALSTNMSVLIENEYLYDEVEVLNMDENAYVFKFVSQKAKRIIDIRYDPSTDEMPDYYAVFIRNFEGGRIFLSTIIKDHKLPYDLKNFILTSYPGNFEKKLQGFTLFLNKLLKEHFYEIVVGEKWEDIAFDWAGYK